MSSTHVLRCYRERARRADAALNAVMEWLDEEADAAAAELDEELRRTGVPRGPLHGVPCTVKDHFHIKGTKITMGDAR